MAQICDCTVAHRITQERVKDIQKASQLVDKIRILGGLSIKDRSYHLRTYKSCFVASELIDWLVTSGEVGTRKEAIQLGQLLVNTDYIHHVVDEHNFEDAYLFFRFRQDESPESSLQGPSVVYMKGQSNALIGFLAKKRMVLGWTYYFFVLSPTNKRIYQYRSELDASPLMCFDITNTFVQPESPADIATSGRYILHIYNKKKDRVVCLSADSSETQFTWLRALTDSGVTLLPAVNEVEAKLKQSSSIFEFEAKNIDGELVSLDQYRGHVTLIVNVASQ